MTCFRDFAKAPASLCFWGLEGVNKLCIEGTRLGQARTNGCIENCEGFQSKAKTAGFLEPFLKEWLFPFIFFAKLWGLQSILDL